MGVLNGSFIAPEATRREKVQMGKIHWTATNKIRFPAEQLANENH